MDVKAFIEMWKMEMMIRHRRHGEFNVQCVWACLELHRLAEAAGVDISENHREVMKLLEGV